MEEMLHEKCGNPAELVLVHILVCLPAPQALLWGEDGDAWEALAGLRWQQRGCRCHGDAGSMVGGVPWHGGTWA